MDYRKVKRISREQSKNNFKTDALSFVILMSSFFFMLYIAYRVAKFITYYDFSIWIKS